MKNIRYQLVSILLSFIAWSSLSFWKTRGHDVEYYYSMPLQSPVGVIFFAHGCHHSASDWFVKSDACQHCSALPVEIKLMEEALSRNLVTVAVSSMNRYHKCWTERDRERVAKVLKLIYDDVLKGFKTEELPLYLFGASSGGSFVSSLALPTTALNINEESLQQYGLNVRKIVIQISSIGEARKVRAGYPPSLFVHMKRDERTSEFVSANLKLLSYFQIPSLALPCDPLPITAKYFHINDPSRWSLDESAAIVNVLSKDGFLDASGYLIEDPRATQWRKV